MPAPKKCQRCQADLSKHPHHICRNCGQDICPEDIESLKKRIEALRKELHAKRELLQAKQLCYCDNLCWARAQGEA